MDKDTKGADTFECGILVREMTLETLEVKRGEDKTARVTFSASSEFPVERNFGWGPIKEILSHEATAVRMGRIKNGGAPFLYNHDRWDHKPIGMLDGGRLENKRLVVDAHFFDTPSAQEVARMVEGGLRNVSVGYRIHKVVEDTRAQTVTVTDWEPIEVSVVPIGADGTVGFGRSAETRPGPTYAVRRLEAEAARGAGQQAGQASASSDGASHQPAAETANKREVNMEATRQEGPGTGTAAGEGARVVDAAAPEQLRIVSILKMCSKHNISDQQRDEWIHSGVADSDVAGKILDIIAERSKKNATTSPASLNMTDKEVKQFSVTRAVRACVEKNWPSIAPFEAEASIALARQLGRQTNEHTFLVPLEVQRAALRARQQVMQRDLVAGTGTLGGYLVGTDVTSFIELLRNRSVVMRMGATMLTGLVGSVAIPKQVGSGTGYWFASEAGTATESNQTFGQLLLSMKTVGGYTEISRQLLIQSTPSAETLVNADLAATIGLAVDTAALAGPGTAGQPTGIVNTSGVGTANPTAGTDVNYADMIRFQTVVASSNAMLPGFGYVTTPDVAGILMGKSRFTNGDTPIWDGNILDGRVAGMPGMTSLQMGSGSCLAGDFSQVVIAEWGVLEIEANPYAQFQAGIVGVRALYSVDVGVRYGAAFALGTGLTG